MSTTDEHGHSPITELELAERYADSTSRRLVFATDRVRLQLKRNDFAATAALADSLLAATPSDAPMMLTPVMALAGRGDDLARALSRHASSVRHVLPDGRSYSAPPELNATVMLYNAYATVGAPAESIIASRVRVERQLRSLVPPRSVDSVRAAVLRRPASLAVPSIGLESVRSLLGARGVARAQQLADAGDRRGALLLLDSLQRWRGALPAGAAMIDQIYLEAALRFALGDLEPARQSLDLALNGFAARGTSFISSAEEAGAVTRALHLRALIRRDAADAMADRAAGAATALERRTPR